MGKSILVIIFLLCFTSIRGQDVVNVNMDKSTLEEVLKNTATQSATNALHNIQVDSIKQKQRKLMTLITGIAAEKELLMQTYRNVSGFKKESKYYIAMARTGADIIKHSSQAVDIIGKSKLEGKAMAIINVSNLVTKAISLGKAFSDIVANCEVPNPLNQDEKGQKDKYNLLNRHERLYMANDILMRLRNIDSSLCYLIYLVKNSGWRDLLFQLDRKTYTTYIMTRVNTNEIIRKWDRVTD